MSASDNTVRIWETSTGQCVSTLRGHRSRIWDVDATASGDKIASASGDHTVKIWKWDAEHEADKYLATLEGHNGDVYAARWHPMGVSYKHSRPHSDGTDAVSSQNHVATGGYDKIVRLIDVESGTTLKTFTGKRSGLCSRPQID